MIRVAVLGVLALAACHSSKQPEAFLKPTEPFATIPGTADEMLAACRARLALAKDEVARTKAAQTRTVAATLEPYHMALIQLANAGASASLFAEVHPDAALRDAARTCEQEVSAYATELSLDRDLYEAIRAIDVSAADTKTRRFVEHTLRDYRRSGVDKDEATRARLRVIDDELTKLSQAFSKNIAEDTRSITVGADDLAGLPDDFVAAHPVKDGKRTITTDYPDYNPVISYATNDDVRKRLYIAFRSRADQQNDALLRQVLVLRAEKAALLDYANWADYVTADKMIGSAANAAAFIERVWKLATPRAQRDYKELLSELKKTMPAATAVADWQKAFLETQIKKNAYEVDAAEVRAYFPFAATLQGLLDITSEIYDIRYQAVDVPRWDASVKVYDVLRGTNVLGRIYLDMHPREGKYKHAAQFTIIDGVAGRQLPEGALVCNFPKPEGDGIGLMEHDDVVTMFHEFGHLMHHVLGGHQTWVRQAGVATEWDFVEAPSQMFEEWAWNHTTLSRFAKHHRTGDVISSALVDKMVKAEKFGIGTQVTQQMFYASLSLGYHTADPKTLDPLAYLKQKQAQYTPFAFVEGTSFHTSFGHLMSYSAIYYTYMWSLVIAKDLLTPFETGGLMNRELTHRYRDRVLAKGGTADAADLVKDFLGRDYSFAAFERYLSE